LRASTQDLIDKTAPIIEVVGGYVGPEGKFDGIVEPLQHIAVGAEALLGGGLAGITVGVVGGGTVGYFIGRNSTTRKQAISRGRIGGGATGVGGGALVGYLVGGGTVLGHGLGYASMGPSYALISLAGGTIAGGVSGFFVGGACSEAGFDDVKQFQAVKQSL
jgi:hypothetical protein